MSSMKIQALRPTAITRLSAQGWLSEGLLFSFPTILTGERINFAAFNARPLLFGRNYHLLAGRHDECFVGILDDPVSKFVVNVTKFARDRTRDL